MVSFHQDVLSITLCGLLSSWNSMSVKERKPASLSWNDPPVNVEKVREKFVSVEKVYCNLDTSLNTPLGNKRYLLVGFLIVKIGLLEALQKERASRSRNRYQTNQ
jgi:hypothetical protein